MGIAKFVGIAFFSVLPISGFSQTFGDIYDDWKARTYVPHTDSSVCAMRTQFFIMELVASDIRGQSVLLGPKALGDSLDYKPGLEFDWAFHIAPVVEINGIERVVDTFFDIGPVSLDFWESNFTINSNEPLTFGINAVKAYFPDRLEISDYLELARQSGQGVYRDTLQVEFKIDRIQETCAALQEALHRQISNGYPNDLINFKLQSLLDDLKNGVPREVALKRYILTNQFDEIDSQLIDFDTSLRDTLLKVPPDDPLVYQVAHIYTRLLLATVDEAFYSKSGFLRERIGILTRTLYRKGLLDETIPEKFRCTYRRWKMYQGRLIENPDWVPLNPAFAITIQ